MGFQTVASALKMLQKPASKEVEGHRCELLELLNLVREHIFLTHERVEFLNDIPECFEVQEFCPCETDCETVLGITAPFGVETVTAAFRSKSSMPIYGKWRGYQVGMDDYANSIDLELRDLGFNFSTERDIHPCGAICNLKAMVTDPRDEGKSIWIQGKDAGGQPIKDRIRLTMEYQETAEQFASIDPIGGVRLSEGLKGGVVLAQADGRVLSEYKPQEVVPSYRRYEVHGVKKGSQIVVRTSRRYVELLFDHEIVEFDSRLILTEAAIYILHKDSHDPQSRELAREKAANVLSYLSGVKSRESDGQVKQFDQMRRPVTRSRLHGRQYR